MNKQLKYATIAASFIAALSNQASACVSIFGPCADAELPMSASSFQINAKGGPTLINPTANAAILQSAAQGCSRRGYNQFVIAGTQTSASAPPIRYFQAWGEGNGIYGNSVNVPPRQATTAVIQCVRQGGLDVRKYMNANE